MTTINDLSVASSVSSDDKFPIWQNANGVTRALPVSVLDGRYLTQADVASLAADAKVEMFISSILPNPLGLPTFVAGTTTSLTLDNQYYSAENIEPFFDASFQGPDQYSLIGYGLNFNTPIPVGVQMVYVRGGAARVIGAPSDGTVTTAKIVDGAVTESKISNSSVSDAKLEWGLTLRRNFSSIAQLRATNDTRFQSCFVTGYYNSLDGGGGPYEIDASDTTSSDNGGSIIVDALGRRWKLNTPPDWYVEQFGGGGIGGGADDAVYINKAIDALPLRGGTVRLRGKQYNIATTIQIGDGNGTNVPSTRSGIKLVGTGSGYGPQNPSSTTIQIIDTGASSPYLDKMLSINGSINDVQIEGIKFYGGGANGCLINTGIFMQASCGTRFTSVGIFQYKVVGLWILAGGAPTGNYNVSNEFHLVTAASTANGHIGLLMDGVYSVSNDTWLSSFYNCRFDTTSSLNATAGYLKFVDSINFHRCHFVGNNTAGVPLSGCVGVYFNAVGNNGFPSGIHFDFCSVLTTFVNETASDKIRVNTFTGYGTYDNETIPTHPKLIGYTDQGHPFNGWGT
jgi:hypothetical protein